MRKNVMKRRLLFASAFAAVAVVCIMCVIVITVAAHGNTLEKSEDAQETILAAESEADIPDAFGEDVMAAGAELVFGTDAGVEINADVETADSAGMEAAGGAETSGGAEMAAAVNEAAGAETNAAEESASGGESETTGESASNSQESEYSNLAIAKVNNYVNVRSEANTDSEIVGKMYDGSVAQIQEIAGDDKDWLKVISGSVEGYIKSEYFIYGDDAAAVASEYVTRYLEVKADRLNVRKEPDISSKRIGYIDNGERVKLIEWGDEWSKVKYADAGEGYVASEYVTIKEEFIYAKSIEEERAELAALAALQARTQTSEEAAPERRVISVPPPQTNYATVSELRTAIVNYAMQFKGNRYVHGGRSLETGTDCSGFTCYVYAAFGYSISRTPQGQLSSAGRAIDMSEIQPGDIICYSSNGVRCTHVAMYIGNGQIIHSANSRVGVVVGDYKFDGAIWGVRSVVD